MIGIVREALHNVRKHAQAERSASRCGGSTTRSRSRSSTTASASTVRQPDGHFGLEQIRELAEETGGSLEIGSGPGPGTSVRACIPMHTAVGVRLVPGMIRSPSHRIVAV